MQISSGTLMSFMAFAPLMLYGQPGPSSPPAPAVPPAPMAPSSVIQPALSTVESTIKSLKIDKWKKGSVRDEAGDNVNSILRDLKNNVPPLLSDADSAPGALSKSLPLLKHLDALYAVVLRVEEGARVSAPSDQIDQLAAALKAFSGARINLYDNMTAKAAGQEKQVNDLQATIKAQQAEAQERKSAPPPGPVPCTPPKAAPKKKRPAAAKPAQPAAGQPAPTPPAQPKTP